MTRLRYIVFIFMVLFHDSFAIAQPVIKPLKFSKGLQQKLDKKLASKQTDILSMISQVGIKYFRSITGKSIELKPVKMDEHVTMQQQVFETTLDWPGSDDAVIQVDKTLNDNVPSYEVYTLRYTFYAESKIDSARKMFRDIYESINGCIVLIGGKAILIDEPFVPLAAGGKDRYKALIDFKQFFKEVNIHAMLEFTTEIGGFYNITLLFSKTRTHNKDR